MAFEVTLLGGGWKLQFLVSLLSHSIEPLLLLAAPGNTPKVSHQKINSMLPLGSQILNTVKNF